uniref:hypothetical protein n=1 Tax=Algoriphagus sp. TaxID=1872435 RepID=UPI004047A3F2
MSKLPQKKLTRKKCQTTISKSKGFWGMRQQRERKLRRRNQRSGQKKTGNTKNNKNKQKQSPPQKQKKSPAEQKSTKITSSEKFTKNCQKSVFSIPSITYRIEKTPDKKIIIII